MNENQIKAKHQTAIYKLKEGTKTSYYYQSGIKTLPERIGFNKFEFAKTNRIGRNLHQAKAQLKATFKKSETSLYKKNKPFTIHTNIWQVPGHLLFIGYGSIGFSDKMGGITDTNDLIIIYSNSVTWHELEIHIFPGMLMYLEDIFPYLENQKGIFFND
ncbi:MAG: hypothetical protein WCO13_14385 [Bacteroidota bacterium]